MSTQPIYLLDRKSNQVVTATLHDGLTQQQLRDAEASWAPARQAAAEKMRRKGVAAASLPQHSHWDWTRKAAGLGLLANRYYGIEYGGRFQGLMKTTTINCQACVEPDKGRPLVYIEFLESAPWNLKSFTDNPELSPVGSRLFEVAVRQSIDEGFFGRVGLHSLPQAEGFYRDKCRMTELGCDPDHQGLRYFELTRLQAKNFLAGGR